MPDTEEKRTDCEVCNRLSKKKHKHDFIWKIACLIFAVLAVVFACLYFGSGAVTTTTEITIDGSHVGNEGGDGAIIIGNDSEVVTGTVEKTDYTPIICISIIAGAVILVFGGIIIAHNHKKDN